MRTTAAVPVEAIAALRRRLAALPARHPERFLLMDSTASLYGVLSGNPPKFCDVCHSHAFRLVTVSAFINNPAASSW
jgi:hypothetical protein